MCPNHDLEADDGETESDGHELQCKAVHSHYHSSSLHQRWPATSLPQDARAISDHHRAHITPPHTSFSPSNCFPNIDMPLNQAKPPSISSAANPPSPSPRRSSRRGSGGSAGGSSPYPLPISKCRAWDVMGSRMRSRRMICTGLGRSPGVCSQLEGQDWPFLDRL